MKSLQELDPVIEPEGDRCITLRYGDVLNAETSLLCLSTAQKIEQAGLAGVLDVIPSFTTVAVHYEPRAFAKNPYRSLCAAIATLLRSPTAARSDRKSTRRKSSP